MTLGLSKELRTGKKAWWELTELEKVKFPRVAALLGQGPGIAKVVKPKLTPESEATFWRILAEAESSEEITFVHKLRRAALAGEPPPVTATPTPTPPEPIILGTIPISETLAYNPNTDTVFDIRTQQPIPDYDFNPITGIVFSRSTQQPIEDITSITTQQTQLVGLFQKVFPTVDNPVEALLWAGESPENAGELIQLISRIGRSEDTVALLTYAGFTGEEIDSLLGGEALVPFEEEMKLWEIIESKEPEFALRGALPSKELSPTEVSQFLNLESTKEAISDWIAKTIAPDLLGYVPAKPLVDLLYDIKTGVYPPPSAPPGKAEIWLKDNIIDPFVVGGIHIFQGLELSATVILPTIIADAIKDKELSQSIMKSSEEHFLKLSKRNEEFLNSMPSLVPKPEYEQNPFENPELFTDPGYWAYNISNSLAYSLGVMGTIITVTTATGGNILLGLGAGMVVAGAAEAPDMVKELLDRGIPFEEATKWGILYGAVAGGVESVSNIPLLSVLFKPAKQAMKPFWDTLFRGTASNLVKAGITGGIVTTIEGFEEAVTQATRNAIIKHFDEFQSLWEGVDVAFIRGAMAASPFGLLGGTASYISFRSALPSSIQTDLDSLIGRFKDAGATELEAQVMAVNEIAKTEEGARIIDRAIQQAKAFIKDERGGIGREEIIPSARINKITWDAMAIPERVVLVVSRGLTEAVGSKAFETLTPSELTAIGKAPVTPTVPEVKLYRTTRGFEEDAALRTELETEQGYKLHAVFETPATAQSAALELAGQDIRFVKHISTTGVETWEVYAKPLAVPVAEPGLPEAVAPTEITKGMRTSLKKLGYTDEQISKMTPLEARDFLGVTAQLAKPPAPKLPTSPGEVIETAPVPKGATGRVFKRIEIDPTGVGIADKIKQGWHRFNVKMVDDLYAVKKFTEEVTKGGVELSIEENPYMLARLLKGITSKSTVFLEQGTFGKKFWKIEKGKAVPNFTGESLDTILKDVSKPEQWQDFTTYLVSRRSVELANRDIITGINKADAQAAINELEAKYKNFNSLAKRVYKYQDSLLVYANEMGLISKDLLGKLRKFGDYVPFYRVFDELQRKGFMGKKMANIAPPIKRIKGSEREIINPLESIVKNTYTLISAADRNQVGIAMANLVDKNPEIAELFERVKTPMAKVASVNAKELGVEIEGLSAEDADKVVDIFRPAFFVSGDEVTVILDGQKAYFRVDPDLRDALLTLDRETMGMLGKILSAPAKWLRAGATLSPDFMVRNPLRDQLTAFAYSNYGFLPGIDFMRGVASILQRDADYQLFRLSGAEHSMMVSMDRQYLQSTFKEIVEGKKFTNYIKHPLELFQIVSELGEKATRLGEFKGGIRRGAVPLQAGFSARNVSLDFAQAGTNARAINRIIAFFNANIRGWGRMMSSFKEHPVRTAIKIFLGITLPSILLYLANKDDPRWKEIPQWEKDLFWIIMTDDNIYRIPKPFELGIIFGSMPERFMEYLDTKEPGKLTEVLLNMAEAGSPGYIPTALLPIIENISDYSFFRGRSIVPASRQDMPPELQYTRWSSEVAKKLGELLGYSPAKIDNIINGWTGGLGRYATDILGAILKGTGISPDIPEPSPTLADIPVLKAFVVRNPFGSRAQAVVDFYETLEEYQRGEKYLKEMLKLGEIEKFETYKAAHPELLFFYDFENDVAYSASARYLRRVARDLSSLRKKEDEIFNSRTMSSQEKRTLIDEIDKVRFEVARRAMDLFLGEEPPILQKELNEAEDRLGEVIETVPVLSLDEPDIYNIKDLSRDYANTLKGATQEEISKMKGMPKTVDVWFAKEESEAKQLALLNTPIYKVDTDEEYELLTRRHKELYDQVRNLTGEELATFRKEHPEVNVNPRDEWLKANPEDNAKLAIWGQAKILTPKAYKIFKTMLEDLDIPDGALTPQTLPPEGSVENYFKYQGIVEDFGANSAEARLLMIEDDDLRKFLGRQPVETPLRALELDVEWATQDDKYNALPIEDRDSYLEEHPEYAIDRRKRDAYDIDLPEELMDTYVEWYTSPDTQKPEGFVGTYYGDDWYLQEHPEFYNAMVELGVWKERDFSKVPTRNVFALYEEWQDIPIGSARREFEAANPELDQWLHLTRGTMLESER